jgi:hypothetical protein
MAGAKQQIDDEHMILMSFIDQADQGEDALARYLVHCGITANDIGDAGDVQRAIFRHYRQADGKYDIAAAAYDLIRWPPIAARIKQLKRGNLRSS